MQVVLPTGEMIRIGGAAADAPGYDLTGLFVGSEGTLGLVTEITVKLTRLPEETKTLLAIYDRVEDATETVAEITARGITPAACEMLDGWSLRAIEAYIHAGYPIDSAAVLLIDVDGLREAAAAQSEQVADVCRAHNAREVRVAKDSRERDLLWKGRKNAFAAVGRLSPSYYVQDGVIPRTKLPATLRRIEEIGKKYGFEIGNIFHAGDGNLHPIVPFDGRDQEQFRRAVAASDEIIEYCVSAGGTITGEHGVGMEKDRLMPLMFSEAEMELMKRVRNAFNPVGLLNPEKIFPSKKGCGEIHSRPANATLSEVPGA
jgi:glycolate oxidase